MPERRNQSPARETSGSKCQSSIGRRANGERLHQERNRMLRKAVGPERSGDGDAFSGGLFRGWFVLAPGRSAAPFGRSFGHPGGRPATAWTAAGCQALQSKNGLFEL